MRGCEVVSNKKVTVLKAFVTDSENGATGGIKRVAAYCRVSTDDTEQLKSYESQVRYYRTKIAENKNWYLVDIYADEGISGISIAKRPGFQKMIEDCKAGKIDIILTKSISRFSRNIVDTLENIRDLRDMNIAVIFEEEHINTLNMQDEFFLTLLSSVYQQEIYNTSAHVKAGIKMKMKRGEMVSGFHTFGYDYDKTEKNLKVNKEEAEIVRKIFEWYTSEVGSKEICRRLMTDGVLSPCGKKQWYIRTIDTIINNNKYIGILEQGKTYRPDPVSGVSKRNFGEFDRYILEDHHEPIISIELFNKAQAIMQERRLKLGQDKLKGKHREYSECRFSRKIRCAYCGKFYTKRTSMHHNKQKPDKHYVYWAKSCDKEFIVKNPCICQASISENAIEEMFMSSFNKIYQHTPKILDDFIDKLGKYLRLPQEKIRRQIRSLEQRQSDLLDKHLDGLIGLTEFEEDYNKLKRQRDELVDELINCKKQANVENRLAKIKAYIKKQPLMKSFNYEIFDSLVDEVIVGGYDDTGNPVENKVTFVYKAGLQDEFRIDKFFNKEESAPIQLNTAEQKSQDGKKKEQPDPSPHVHSICSLVYSEPFRSCSKYIVNTRRCQDYFEYLRIVDGIGGSSGGRKY